VINLGFYPFLWCWTIIGSVWLTRSGSCLPEQSNYWGVLVWLVVGYFSLIVYGLLVTMAVRSVLAAQNGPGVFPYLSDFRSRIFFFSRTLSFDCNAISCSFLTPRP
jgi:hypothetical protein